MKEGNPDYADALKLVHTFGSLDGPDTPWLRAQIQAQREQEREQQIREQHDLEKQIREEQERKVCEEQRKDIVCHYRNQIRQSNAAPTMRGPNNVIVPALDVLLTC